MDIPIEKFKENFNKAVKSLQIADHMTYVTFPLVKEKRLLIKIFDETNNSIINCINAILNYEYLYKRIRLYQDNQENLRTFFDKCGKNYGLTNEQMKKIKEIIELNKEHKASSMEFVRKEKIIIMSKNLGTKSLDLTLVKEYLLLAKEVLSKTKQKIL